MRYLVNKCPAYLAFLILAGSILAIGQPAIAATENEILKQSIAELRQQLEAMEQKLEALSKNVDQNAQAVEVTAEAVESYSAKSSTFDKLSFEGYGELHYNNYNARNSDHDVDEIDFHRFVFGVNYQFSDKLSLHSEFELEHSVAGDDENGALELEKAVVEYSFNEYNEARVGMFLLPVGIINQKHSPASFYGVERNAVENIIVPSGWRAAGIGYTHRTDNGFSFDIVLHEGLEVDVEPTPDEDGTFDFTDEAGNNFDYNRNAHVRDGRQNASEASADDPAMTGRIKYTGAPGLELGATVNYQSDITQESGDGLDDAYLYELHLAYNKGPFGLRTLYAEWDMDTENDADGVGQAIENAGSDEQEGWYIEPSFRLNDSFGIFARYEDVEGGRLRDRFDQWAVGFNYWLNENVVLKADYIDREYDEEATDEEDSFSDFDGFNLGFGYDF